MMHRVPIMNMPFCHVLIMLISYSKVFVAIEVVGYPHEEHISYINSILYKKASVLP